METDTVTCSACLEWPHIDHTLHWGTLLLICYIKNTVCEVSEMLSEQHWPSVHSGWIHLCSFAIPNKDLILKVLLHYGVNKVIFILPPSLCSLCSIEHRTSSISHQTDISL